jgi:FG-GAP-like repeat/FG-GAP repeat
MKMLSSTRAGAVPFAAPSWRRTPSPIVARVVASAAVIGALVYAPQPAAAQFTQQGPKLVGSGAISSEQGTSVAVSADGNTAIIGGPELYSLPLIGGASVFTRSNGVWIQQGNELVGTGGIAPQQGFSVALSGDGNTAILGGPYDDRDRGAAWVFTRSNGVWTQQGDKLVGAGALPGSHEGWSVALSADGNTAVLGAPDDSSEVGAAWVFTRSNGVWTQQGGKLVGAGAVGQAHQGGSVALSVDGSTAIVGGHFDNSLAGAAWVFTRSNSVWTQQGNKLVGAGAMGASFPPEQGSSVGLSADGNTAIIGGPGDNLSIGAAWVFTRSNGVWNQQGNKLVGTGVVGFQSWQGQSVALSADSNTAIIGGWGDNSFIGAAWIFTRSNGMWTQYGSKLVGTGVVGQQSWQGQSVALSADGRSTAIIGGPQDNSYFGAAWVFTAPRKLKPNTHDFNGDGMSDIAWRDNSGNTAIWLMNGAAVLSSGEIGPVPTSFSIVGQRDFDGDGKTDLLWRDNLGNTSIWFMNGVQVASSASIGNLPTTWSVVGTGDFNGDGLGDILWQDSSGNLMVWLMAGASILQSAEIGNVPFTWSVAGTGDFNGDGKTDLLWRDTSGNTAIWFMNGVEVASSASVGNILTTWSVVGTGDFNGDGMSDIAWRDNRGNVSIWLMNGAAVSASGGLGIGVNWKEWSIVQTGDYNGDGKSDLLWRDILGNTAIWFMNGVSVSSTGSVDNIPTAWTVQSVNAE